MANDIELERLRDIGWQEWDPIGLRESDCPRDEYDSYLLEVASRLTSGASVEDAAASLDLVRAEFMRLDLSTQASRAASVQTVVSIKAYLDTLPPSIIAE